MCKIFFDTTMFVEVLKNHAQTKSMPPESKESQIKMNSPLLLLKEALIKSNYF